jgi:hypothetical protein
MMNFVLAGWNSRRAELAPFQATALLLHHRGNVRAQVSDLIVVRLGNAHTVIDLFSIRHLARGVGFGSFFNLVVGP